MPQLLALEWDGSEARMVVASSRGDGVVIERAFSTTLRPQQSDDEASEVDVGERIAAALSAEGVGRIDTLVAVGRSSIELRQLALPPAPEEELPEMVRFQAMREFNELDENWLLDFVPIGEPTEEGQNVLAAAIGPKLVGQIEKTCRTAGLKPQRLVLRPCAAAALLGRASGAGASRPRLLVDLLSDEADLTVMIGPKVVFLRTARMGGDPLRDESTRRTLLAEIRRTLAAAHNQLGGERVESIVLCGAGEEHTALADTIQKDLGTSTELFDPFGELKLGRRLQQELPENPGRFAPLLGMALAELEETGHAIDFLHPRRRREPPRKLAKFILLGAVAALAIVGFFVYGSMQRSGLRERINALSKESRELEIEIAEAEQAKAVIDRIQQWSKHDVCWLDELEELSREFPPANKAMLTSLLLNPDPSGGRMDLAGLVDKPTTIGRMEDLLRDKSHRPEGGPSAADSSKPPFYEWSFQSSLVVTADQEKP